MDYLKANAPFWKREEKPDRNQLGRRPQPRRRRRRALDQILMAKRSKTGGKAARRTQAKIAQGRSRRTADAARFRPLCGQPLHRSRTGVRAWHHRSGGGGRLPGLRNAASSSRPVRGVCHGAGHRAEGKAILDVIARRVATRKPTAYLVNKIYMRGLPFYVDERTIVPRSFIGELLDSHFGGDDDEAGGSLIEDPGGGRKRARPLHRLGLSRHPGEPEFSQRRDRRGGHFKGRARRRRAQRRRLRPARTGLRCTAATCSSRSPAGATT